MLELRNVSCTVQDNDKNKEILKRDMFAMVREFPVGKRNIIPFSAEQMAKVRFLLTAVRTGFPEVLS